MARVYLHIGSPKTGTTYLQDVLAKNRTTLASHGLLYPDTRYGTHFEAAIDLTEHRWGGAIKQAGGQWEHIAKAARSAPDRAVISHEVLAAATPKQVAAARESLGGGEIHIVLTARDLARQIPAEWQETVKHRGRKSFARFMRDVRKGTPATSDLWFWRVQSLPDVLTRWGQGLPPSNVHVVTVPASGSDPGLLWQRYASVLGISPELSLEPGSRANASLGIAETKVVRLLNQRLRGRGIARGVYADTVREILVHKAMAERTMSARATVAPDHRPWVNDITAQWMDWLQASGVNVVGDVNDLVPKWDDAGAWIDPDQPDDEEVIDAAIAALAELIADRGQSYRPTAMLRRGLGHLARRMRG